MNKSDNDKNQCEGKRSQMCLGRAWQSSSVILWRKGLRRSLTLEVKRDLTLKQLGASLRLRVQKVEFG